MIIDFHTHIFPPEVRENRDDYLQRDPTFAEMYANPRAEMATAEDLLRSMEESGVDISVALGFAWREHELCVRHNDYLLDAAAKSGGRIVPFWTVNTADRRAEEETDRCLRGGGRGIGELRPESQGWELDGQAGERLAALARRHGFILLFHVTEPAGHDYPGKAGLRLDSFSRFVARYPQVKVVGAHLAGGLPFYAWMPEVGAALAKLYMDTAAQPLLYEGRMYSMLLNLIGAERLLLGSDFPLVAQGRQIAEIQAAVPDAGRQRLILGGNAGRLLDLSDDRALK